jgi:hypothetical protein
MTWWKNRDKNRAFGGPDRDEDDSESSSQFNERNQRDDEQDEDFQGPKPENEDNVRHLPAPLHLTNGYHNNNGNGKKKKKKENGFSYNYGRYNSDRDDDYDYGYGYGSYGGGWGSSGYSSWKPKTEKDFESYDFLKEYSQVFNLYTASTPSISPYSNKAIYIIDILSKLGIKFRCDIFPATSSHYSNGNAATDTTSHRLINIIAEPNPNVQGPAIVFSAHHDVANVRSENCQDNGASVCNLLRLASLISQSPADSQRTLIVFTDCEESGARGARRFAEGFVSDYKRKDKNDNMEHEIHGEISGVVILELTGHGKEIWTDCTGNQKEQQLHRKLEAAAKKTLPKFSTPPSDVSAFRGKGAALCIGTLKTEDLRMKETWRICHSMTDTIELCEEDDMKDFTEFLHAASKIGVTPLTEESETAQLELELEVEEPKSEQEETEPEILD